MYRSQLGNISDWLNFDFGLDPSSVDLKILLVENVNWIIGLVGLIALSFFIVGAVMFITAGGDEQRLTKAITTIRNAIIGLILVLLSGVIINFIINRIEKGDQSPSKIEKGTINNPGK